MIINIPLAGPTYASRSTSVSAQHTKNFYIEADPQANEQAALMPFPGLKSFSSAGNGPIKGLQIYKGTVYCVSGSELYSVNSVGVSTLIGTVNCGDRVSMVEDDNNLVIATGTTKPYEYDGTLTLGTDADLPTANTVAEINDRVIYDDITGIAFADLNTPLTVNSANVLSTNTRSGTNPCVAVVTHKQQVYAFCKKTIEVSYFTGTGTPPYSRVNNATQETGTEAPYTVTYNKDYIYYLGSDRNVYQLSGFSSRPISNPAIGKEIENYETVSDAYGYCFNFDSQFFYLLSFPTEGHTWLFNQNVGIWTNLGYDVSGGASLISGYTYAYGKHLVGDRRNPNIYELDFSTYTDNGDTIQRIRTTRSISGKDFGIPGKRLFMSSLRLLIEPGQSLVTAESQIIMQYSDDDGKTWSSERWLYIGDQGDNTYQIEWFGLGSFYKRMFRFIMSDAIKWVLVSLEADVEVGL